MTSNGSHSLSGEGSPFNFTVGGTTFGHDDTWTKFMEGQSLGFRMARSFWKDWGISIGGTGFITLTTQQTYPAIYTLKAPRYFGQPNTQEPPIAQVTLGLMTDVHNPDSMLGSMAISDMATGGLIPFNICRNFWREAKKRADSEKSQVSSAFVCAEETVRDNPRPPQTASRLCSESSFWPAASIGIALRLWLSPLRHINAH